jgi:hypothetical protein
MKNCAHRGTGLTHEDASRPIEVALTAILDELQAMGIRQGLELLMDEIPVRLENASVFIINASASIVYPQPYIEWLITLGTSDHRSATFTLDELREPAWPGFTAQGEGPERTARRVSSVADRLDQGE